MDDKLKAELIENFKRRMLDVKKIIELDKEGKTLHEISAKLRVGHSYIIHVLKLGYDAMEQELAKEHSITIPTKEKPKDEVHATIEQEFLCMDCNKICIQIESVFFEGYEFRMYRCPECKKVYPHPLDSQSYLNKEK